MRIGAAPPRARWSPAARLAGLRPPRPGRRALVIAPCVVAVTIGGWMWLRGSALVAVQKVTVSGVRGPGASDIRATLIRTAMGMSTMHVDRGRLLAAVAPYRVVRELRLSPAFPHGLRITVIEDPVVALLAGGGAAAQPVTMSGAIVPGAPMPSALPEIRLPAPLVGLRVRDRSVLTQLAVLGAAPDALRARVTRVFRGPEGLELGLRSGPVLWFGDASRPHAKWLAAERILADAGDQGIAYIDVRIPNRPAARVVNSSGAMIAGGLTGTTTSPTDALGQALQSTATGGATTAAGAGTGAGSGTAASGTGAGNGTPAAAPATPASSSTPGLSGPSSGTGAQAPVGGVTATGGAAAGASAGAGSGTAPTAAAPASAPGATGTPTTAGTTGAAAAP